MISNLESLVHFRNRVFLVALSTLRINDIEKKRTEPQTIRFPDNYLNFLYDTALLSVTIEVPKILRQEHFTFVAAY